MSDDRTWELATDVTTWGTLANPGPARQPDGICRGTTTVRGAGERRWNYLVRILDRDDREQSLHLEVRARPSTGPGVTRLVVAVRVVSGRQGPTVELTTENRSTPVVEALIGTLSQEFATRAAAARPQRKFGRKTAVAAAAIALLAGALAVMLRRKGTRR